ncbi:GxxExxY protein [Pontiellaceae bacterium B12227]|nr:GxxExxY protein [Pontiellaceae bacterium B12227]
MHHQIQYSDIVYPVRTFSIVGAAVDVHNSLGPGWHERDYLQAMVTALEERDLDVISEDEKDLVHRKKIIEHFEVDLVVDDLIILQLSHSKESFLPLQITQNRNCQKRWDVRLGILLNFGQEQLRYKKVPAYILKTKVEPMGEWDQLPVMIRGIIQKAIEAILAEVGHGYDESIFKKLLVAELFHLGFPADAARLNPDSADARFDVREVGAIAVRNDLLLLISSNASATDLCYLNTYMKRAARPYGILVNLEKSKIQLRGVV